MLHLLVACLLLVVIGSADVRAECDEKFETTAGVPDEFTLG